MISARAFPPRRWCSPSRCCPQHGPSRLSLGQAVSIYTSVRCAASRCRSVQLTHGAGSLGSQVPEMLERRLPQVSGGSTRDRTRPRLARRRCRSARTGRSQPVAQPLVQRPRRRQGRRSPARRAAAGVDRGREPDHRRVRRSVPDDHRSQGAGRLRLPRPTSGHRPVRPDPPPGDLAVDRQLRPRWHRDQPHHGQPRRGDPAGGHEPGTFRLAEPVVRRPRERHHPHARHRVERERDLRRLQRARQGPRQLHPQPVQRVREPPRPLRGHRSGARARVRDRSCGVGARSAPGSVHVGDRVGRHDRAPATA